jgi:hypothetical protein
MKIIIMKRRRVITIFLLAAFCQTLSAQYYHRDIVNVIQAHAEKKILQQQKIKTIIVHSFEADGTDSEGFACEKNFSNDYRKMETHTKSQISGKNWLTSYYNEKGLLERASDSSEISVANTFYEYDNNDNVTSITSLTHSADEDFTTSLKEVHKYMYNEKGRPVKMLRIKNSRDSSLVDFILDDKGNVSDEIEAGSNGKHYYYYYDDKNQLTDIVKYNAIKGGLRADFIFEYDNEGHVSQMTAIEEGVAADYYTWKYTYNEGLRIIEKCFSKEKKLLGYFEYEYKE